MHNSKQLWKLKRQWWKLKRKWRKRPLKWKMSILGVGLLALLLVSVWLGSSFITLSSSSPPQAVLESMKECLEKGDVEALKSLLSGRPGLSSAPAGQPDSTSAAGTHIKGTDSEDIGSIGKQSDTSMARLVEDFDKVQELARTGKVHILTEKQGDAVFGTILINSPYGMYHLRVKLKEIDGRWVIVE